MLIETLSTFPHMYDSVMSESMMKRAQEKGILEFRAHDLRDWTHDRHRTTDDDPYGGGAGLVMKCEPIFEAVEAILGKEFVEAKLASAMGEPGGISGGAHQASSAANAISPVGCRAERGLSERLSTTRKPAPEESQADSREPQFAHVQADGTLPHFVPERRLRLFNSLKALGTPAAPTVTTRLWGQITIDTELCRSCRMCTVFCPTGALTIHHNMTDVWQALGDKNTRVVAQIAPAVRVAIGEAFGLPKGENSMGKVVAALHRMGFDEVFDTAYTADLTIMEESAEFLERVKAGTNLPLMTSCCPAWVKFVENEYPEFKENISTCRSPQAMFSAILKDYYRDEVNAKGKKTVVVSVMPCTAKKMEAERKESYTHEEKDTDYVLTTTELIRMIDAHGINFEALPSESCDMPFGIGSGGGVIFGTTGGVTEAVLRRLIEGHDPATLRAIAECGARGDEGIKEFSVPYNGLDVKICVASGLANARKVLESVKSGEKEYHFIEVMACPGGCVMGGGQPVYGTKVRRAETRTKGLYEADGGMAIKKSNENPLMDVFYNGYFKGKAHELLHNPHE